MSEPLTREEKALVLVYGKELIKLKTECDTLRAQLESARREYAEGRAALVKHTGHVDYPDDSGSATVFGLANYLGEQMKALRAQLVEANHRNDYLAGHRERSNREIETLRAQLDEAMTYGKHLLSTIAPQCTPLGDPAGIMTQLDNYIAGQSIRWSKEQQAQLDTFRARCEQLAIELKEKHRSLVEANRNNHQRNLELDALHYVWCDGGCESGVHRYQHKEALTQEVVELALQNTRRLVGWFRNNSDRKLSNEEIKAQWEEKKELLARCEQLEAALIRVLPMVRACKYETFSDTSGNEDTRTEALKAAIVALKA